LAAAQAAAAANEDKFLRARADLENYRRRVGRERAEIAQEAKREVLLRVLDVLDNLERALGYEQAGDQVDAQALLMGLRMTVTQFEDVLSGLGVQTVAACGEQFDPRWHEAVATVVDPAQAEGTIVEEIQRGYHLADALLRPARVRVVAGTAETA
jgi:molecular chaperone GrpE